jgi:hypothetical protein
MGAGKTILIGAIVATEFAMALEYPNGAFVQDALVFAPDKTIIESLRELADIPYEKVTFRSLTSTTWRRRSRRKHASTKYGKKRSMSRWHW